MSRSIVEIIAAFHAGEPLTPDEAQRIVDDLVHRYRFLESRRRLHPNDDLTGNFGEALEAYIGAVLADVEQQQAIVDEALPAFGVDDREALDVVVAWAAMRDHVKELVIALHLIGTTDAETEGDRRWRGRGAGRQSGRARKKKQTKFAKQIAKLRKVHPEDTVRETARRWAKQHYRGWKSATSDANRQRILDNIERKMRRATSK